ncbi:magnesium transporter [Maricaulis sp.]|uniref:magnesium transporter n=1 Tax=Maricaulis sp. TaxID=1486257 RepID=UPI003A900BE4
MSVANPEPELEEPVDIHARIRDAIETDDVDGLEALLATLTLSDALREILQFPPKERDRVFGMLHADRAAELINEAPNEIAVELVERLEAGTAVHIIDELDSDVQADVIGELSDEDAEAILAEMDEQDAADVRRLVSYDDGTAGGLMIAEAFTFHEGDTVGQVLRRLASDDEDFERYRGQHPYILDAGERPVGVVSLRGLLTSKRSAPLSGIMTPPITVSTGASLDELRDVFDRHAFLGIPVVEADGRLAGVVSRSAMDEAVLEKAESDGLKRQGVVGDELRSMPTLLRARRRLAWLSTNIVLNIIAACVISAYEETLTAIIAIAVFLPMVSDMSGCSGNQAVAVTMRELSLGLVKPIDAFRVWAKEASVGVLNGVVLGILIGLVAWVWKGNAVLGAVIGFALALNTILAVSIGGVVPLLLKRFGQDPAAASGPLLTTITDMAGFFLVLSLASAFMPWMV